MSVDPARIGNVTMTLLEDIEQEFGEQAELVRTMLIVEVRYPDEEDCKKMHTTILWQDDEPSPSSKLGLVLTVLRGLLS